MVRVTRFNRLRAAYRGVCAAPDLRCLISLCRARDVRGVLEWFAAHIDRKGDAIVPWPFFGMRVDRVSCEASDGTVILRVYTDAGSWALACFPADEAVFCTPLAYRV